MEDPNSSQANLVDDISSESLVMKARRYIGIISPEEQLVINHEPQSINETNGFKTHISCVERTFRGKFNAIICLIITFVSDVGYSIIIPSLFYYLESTGATIDFYGYVVASWSLGRVVSAPILGYASSRINYKAVLLVALVLALVGDIVYTLAPNKWIILAGRVINGIGSGSKGVVQAYFTDMSSSEDLKVMSKLGVASTLAFVLGPDQRNPEKDALLGSDTSEERKITINSNSSPNNSLNNNDKSNSESDDSYWFQAPALILLSLILFLLYMCLVVYETICAPLTQTNFGWNILENGLLWVLIAIGCGGTYMSLQFLVSKYSDRFIFLVDVMVLVMAMGVMVDPYGPIKMWRFLLGTLLMAISFPMADAVIGSLFRQLGGSNTHFYLGLFVASGAAARVLGPIWATQVYANLPDKEFWVFSITTSCQIVSLMIFVGTYQKFKNPLSTASLVGDGESSAVNDSNEPSSIRYGYGSSRY